MKLLQLSKEKLGNIDTIYIDSPHNQYKAHAVYLPRRRCIIGGAFPTQGKHRTVYNYILRQFNTHIIKLALLMVFIHEIGHANGCDSEKEADNFMLGYLENHYKTQLDWNYQGAGLIKICQMITDQGLI